jgi:hypothetical protein
MMQYKLSSTMGQYKNRNLMPKKDRLIKESVLKDGRHNCPIQKSDLEINDCIGQYNQKIESVLEGQTIGHFSHLFPPPASHPHRINLFREAHPALSPSVNRTKIKIPPVPLSCHFFSLLWECGR